MVKRMRITISYGISFVIDSSGSTGNQHHFGFALHDQFSHPSCWIHADVIPKRLIKIIINLKQFFLKREAELFFKKESYSSNNFRAFSVKKRARKWQKLA